LRIFSLKYIMKNVLSYGSKEIDSNFQLRKCSNF